jgi:hypothetical protein
MILRRLLLGLAAGSALAIPVAWAVDDVHSKHEAPEAAKASDPGAPKLALALVNEPVNARRKWATVKVDVGNVEMIDPSTVNEPPRDQQGHLHYRLNDGPVIATTATKLSFHDLKSGTHTCTVVLAGNDHAPLGPQETVTIKIP